MSKPVMMPSKKRLAAVSVWGVGFWLAAAMLAGWQPAASSTLASVAVVADDHGLAIAEAFVRNSPTFRYDRIPESVRVQSMRPLVACPGCYEYELPFESQHPGFGDRAGRQLAATPTSHRTTIVMRDGRVVSGVLDAAWDMAQQRILDLE